MLRAIASSTWPNMNYDFTLEIANGVGFVLVVMLGLTLVLFLIIQIKERSCAVITLTVGMILIKIGLAIGLGYRWLVTRCNNFHRPDCERFEDDSWILLVSVAVIALGGLMILRTLSRPSWRPWSWLTAMMLSLLIPFFFYTSGVLFPTDPVVGPLVHGFYHIDRVLLSVIVAIFGSYVALDLACHSEHSKYFMPWILVAAFVLGGTIWSMHFIAMLAFELPGVPVVYDTNLTVLSFLIPVVTTLIAFAAAAVGKKAHMPVCLSGLLIAAGVVAMHYTGMAAMRMPAIPTYNMTWVVISVAIAVAGSIAAVRLAFHETTRRQRIIAAVVMGAGGISGLHYSAMVALTCYRGGGNEDTWPGISPAQLTVLVALVTFVILLSLLGLVTYERRMHG